MANKHTRVLGQYFYIIRNTGESSAKFGPCEICGKNVSEIYTQQETRAFWSKVLRRIGYTHHLCHFLFGHKECLESRRRNQRNVKEVFRNGH